MRASIGAPSPDSQRHANRISFTTGTGGPDGWYGACTGKRDEIATGPAQAANGNGPAKACHKANNYMTDQFLSSFDRAFPPSLRRPQSAGPINAIIRERTPANAPGLRSPGQGPLCFPLGPRPPPQECLVHFGIKPHIGPEWSGHLVKLSLSGDWRSDAIDTGPIRFMLSGELVEESMKIFSKAIKSDMARAAPGARPLPQKVQKLLARANYQPPKVILFPSAG